MNTFGDALKVTWALDSTIDKMGQSELAPTNVLVGHSVHKMGYGLCFFT
jgi:hypothetical protein